MKLLIDALTSATVVEGSLGRITLCLAEQSGKVAYSYLSQVFLDLCCLLEYNTWKSDSK